MYSYVSTLEAHIAALNFFKIALAEHSAEYPVPPPKIPHFSASPPPSSACICVSAVLICWPSVKLPKFSVVQKIVRSPRYRSGLTKPALKVQSQKSDKMR